MIASTNAEGKIELAPALVWTILLGVIGAAVTVGVYMTQVEANAEDIKELSEVDNRMVQLETNQSIIREEQKEVQRSLRAARETQSGILAHQRNLEKKLDEVNVGVQEIQRLIRGLNR